MSHTVTRTSYHGVYAAGGKHIVSEHGGHHSGTAHLVDRRTADTNRQPGAYSCLSRRSLTSKQHATHQGLLHVVRHDSRALHSGADRDRPQNGGRDIFEVPLSHSIPSTLRQRLRNGGQNYREIKEEIRRELGMKWLLHSRRSVGVIATELGFAEPSAFHRAFRKWTSQSPGASVTTPPAIYDRRNVCFY